MAPAYAVSSILEDTGLSLQDFDYYEIHEAFAAVPLCLFKAWESADYCRQRLGRNAPLGQHRPDAPQCERWQRGHRSPICGDRGSYSVGTGEAAGERCHVQTRPRVRLHRRRHGGYSDSGAGVSQFETLMARDGHAFQTYLARPASTARGAVIVIQEIFGLTPHILAMADGFAADGYLAVAPALFDRVRRGLVLGDSPEEVERARGYRQQVETPKALLDIAACTAVARHSGKVAVVGYCWGGTLAWLAAAERPLGAAVCYYGSGIAEHLDKTPKCPTQLHFGERDQSIAPATIAAIRAAYPAGEYFTYPAGHGFNNDSRPGHYDAAAAALARERTHEFLAQHIG